LKVALSVSVTAEVEAGTSAMALTSAIVRSRRRGAGRSINNLSAENL
jgi:hypothetical protein